MKDVEPVHLKVTCLQLRHKLMYADARQSTPGLVDDSSDTRVFHCLKTHDSIGPDNQPVSPTECSPSCSCYCQSSES